MEIDWGLPENMTRHRIRQKARYDAKRAAIGKDWRGNRPGVEAQEEIDDTVIYFLLEKTEGGIEAEWVDRTVAALDLIFEELEERIGE